MKKKILSFIFTLCVVLPSMMIFTACDPGNPGNTCQHIWRVTREPSKTVTGAVSCVDCGQDGFVLPMLNNTDYVVCATNPDYIKYTYTKDGETYEFYDSNFEMSYTDEPGIPSGIAITGYNGSSANIVIPARMKHFGVEHNVVRILDEVFKDMTNITSVTLPDTMELIGGGAFRGCSNLVSINLPNGLERIANYAFAESGLTEITFPNTRDVQIGGNCLEGCNNIQKITLPYVGNWTGNDEELAWLFNSELDNSQIPSSLKEVYVYDTHDALAGHGAVSTTSFKGCTSIEKVVVDTKYNFLGSEVFRNCTSLKEVIVHAPLESISWGAFKGCTSLKEIVIPTSVTEIDGSAFQECTSLEAIYFTGKKSECGNITIYEQHNVDEYYKAAAKYYYQETQPTAVEYIENDCTLDMWHYDNSDNKVLWTINLTNNVAGKTYTHSHSLVDVSDTYWAMLQEAEAQGMLGMLFDNDQEMIDMVTSSETKEDYEAKLATYYADVATTLSVSFADGIATLAQNGGGSVELDYIEVDGEIYYTSTKTKAFTYDPNFFGEGSGAIYEEMSTEYFTVRHIHNEVTE